MLFAHIYVLQAEKSDGNSSRHFLSKMSGIFILTSFYHQHFKTQTRTPLPLPPKTPFTLTSITVDLTAKTSDAPQRDWTLLPDINQKLCLPPVITQKPDMELWSLSLYCVHM